MLEQGLVDEKGYFTKKYFEQKIELEENEQENPEEEDKEEIVEQAKEPIYSQSQVEQLMAEMEKRILSSIPSQAPQTPQQNTYQVLQPTNIDILDNIPELENWVIKPREYRLKDGYKPIWRDIQRAHTQESDLQYEDKKTGKSYPMRYSSNQSSFFIEKQNPDPKAVLDTRIAFEFGTLKLGTDKTSLQKFLHIHKHNGVVFEEYDESKVSQNNVISKKLKNKAENLIQTIGKTTNRAIASLKCTGYIEAWTDERVEEAIWDWVADNAQAYIDFCEDPSTKVKGIVSTSIAKGYLIYKNYKFYDTKMEKIIDVSRDKNEIDEMATHLMSGEGRVLYEYLSNKK